MLLLINFSQVKNIICDMLTFYFNGIILMTEHDVIYLFIGDFKILQPN